MKNFNFAFFLSLYVVINVWIAFKMPERSYYLFAGVILTLPLLFLAINSLMKKPGEPQKDSDREFDLMAESLAPYITALVAATAFMVFIYKSISGGEHASLFFVAPRIAGWLWQEGVITGMLSLLMGACGVGIWSAAFRQRHLATGVLHRTASRNIMLLNQTPGVRLALYYVVLCGVAACGGVIVYKIYGASRAYDWPGYVIVAGRSLLPVAVLLPAALLRLPMLPFGVLILGGVGFLFGYNTSYIEGAIFAGTQAVILSILAAALHFRAAKGRAGAPDSSHTQILKSGNDSPDNPVKNDTAATPEIPTNDSL